MKIYTSYFYMIRFMKPYQIPISTAIWDPKWFHESSNNQNHRFVDKNGVINGLRLEYLHPDNQGEDGCKGRVGCNYNPITCKFKIDYRNKIFSLDKNKVIDDFNRIGNYFKNKFNFNEEFEIILIVHEDPNNPCSERSVLQEFFNCEEFKPN